MILQEVDLFRDLSEAFIDDLSNAITKERFEPEQIIFEQGGLAENLYILLEGEVHLTISDEGSVNFLIDKPGEVFGWSAMVEPNQYTARAKCYGFTSALRINAERMEYSFTRHPMDGFHVMKRLAGIVAERLLHSYQDSLRRERDTDPPEYG